MCFIYLFRGWFTTPSITGKPEHDVSDSFLLYCQITKSLLYLKYSDKFVWKVTVQVIKIVYHNIRAHVIEKLNKKLSLGLQKDKNYTNF